MTMSSCVWRCEEARRVHFARPQTQASEPVLAAKRRGECRGDSRSMFFNQSSGPSTMTDRVCFCYVYSRMIRSQERRALGALLSLVSRSKPASPTNCSLSVEWRGDLGLGTEYAHRGSLYWSSNASVCSLCQTIWTRGLPARDSSSITGLALDKSFP